MSLLYAFFSQVLSLMSDLNKKSFFVKVKRMVGIWKVRCSYSQGKGIYSQNFRTIFVTLSCNNCFLIGIRKTFLNIFLENPRKNVLKSSFLIILRTSLRTYFRKFYEYKSRSILALLITSCAGRHKKMIVHPIEILKSSMAIGD